MHLGSLSLLSPLVTHINQIHLRSFSPSVAEFSRWIRTTSERFTGSDATRSCFNVTFCNHWFQQLILLHNIFYRCRFRKCDIWEWCFCEELRGHEADVTISNQQVSPNQAGRKSEGCTDLMMDKNSQSDLLAEQRAMKLLQTLNIMDRKKISESKSWLLQKSSLFICLPNSDPWCDVIKGRVHLVVTVPFI